MKWLIIWLRFSIFTFQDAEITTCKIMMWQWLQPTWFMITICFGLFIVIQVFATKLWRKNIKWLKMSGYKSMGQNFMASSLFIHPWGILKGSGKFLSSIFSMDKYSVFKSASAFTAVLIGLTSFWLAANTLATSSIFLPLTFKPRILG